MTEGLPESAVQDIVTRALAEDVGTGDVTTLAIVDAEEQCRAEIVTQADGVIAGLPVARLTFHAVDPQVAFDAAVSDGARVSEGMTIVHLAGPTGAILTAERTALNFLQRVSGIATTTAEYVEAIHGSAARVLDTRKTAPGLRLLDKYAVRVGGGGGLVA